MSGELAAAIGTCFRRPPAKTGIAPRFLKKPMAAATQLRNLSVKSRSPVTAGYR